MKEGRKGILGAVFYISLRNSRLLKLLYKEWGNFYIKNVRKIDQVRIQANPPRAHSWARNCREHGCDVSNKNLFLKGFLSYKLVQSHIL